MAAEGDLLRAGITPSCQQLPTHAQDLFVILGACAVARRPMSDMGCCVWERAAQLGATADLKMFSGAGKMLQVLASASRKASRRLK